MEPDDQLREKLGRACRASGVPGAALAILDGRGITTAESGVANVETDQPVDVTTRFPIWSITKGYTASLVLQLIEEGKLSLDDPILRYLPELHLADGSQAMVGEITIRQLLANTCGLSGLHFPDTGDGEDALERFLPTLADVALVHPPGERFSYSNPGFVLAGLIVERLTGLSWDAALVDRLLHPLGLHETGTRLEQLGDAPLAVEHRASAEGTAEALPPWRVRSNGPAGSTPFATAVDVVRFAQHQLSPQWAPLREPQVAMPGPHAESWGLGWAIYGWGAGVFGWDGIGLAARTFLRVLPQHGAAVALLTNGDKGGQIYREFLPGLLSERFGVTMAPVRPATLPPDAAPDPAGHEGVYRSVEWDRTVTRSEDGTTLLLDGSPLLPTADPDVFVQQDPEVEWPTVILDGDYANIFGFGFRR
jgi:CubicO group peptidase (beta-lactamase class C family)